jgi:3-phenylpropionate/trans-cinnamate dioxygenase ferredoxin reductase component
MPPVCLQRVAIVGASLAGLHAAQSLRRQGFQGEIAVIGDEPHYPYDRPPLSKDFLAGTTDQEKLRLRPAADPAALGLEWLLGSRAVGLEISGPDGGGLVQVDHGPPVAFDGLIVATGARARPLPGPPPPVGVHLLRTLDDALALRAELDTQPGRVVVVGFGFIGAEVAATARDRGLEVSVIEAAEAPLTRVLDAEAGMAIADLHRGHGVDVRLGTGVAGLTEAQGRVSAVELSDGSSLPATVVVVGIGVIPNTEWLAGAGLTLDNGVVADETCLAGPGVVVAGDVARWPNPRFGQLMRVEQWDNAVEMGAYAGRRLLAWSLDEAIEPFGPVPWFWSDQYDRKIQLAGVAGAEAEVVQGSLAEQRFVRVYHDDGAITGALCWNRPRQAIMARELVAQGATLDHARQALG